MKTATGLFAVPVGIVTMMGSALLTPELTAAQEAARLEEIVVTARRRQEVMQEVPISVAAVTETEIAQRGAVTLGDITTAVPNFYYQDRGSILGNFGIRGIVTNISNAGVESGTAVYVDGVPVGRPEAFDAALQDVAQIEVLRGPQGTLFGKNTIAGAVNIITQRPTREFSADLKLEAGEYSRAMVGGVVNFPVGDDSALRISGSIEEQDGWIDNLLDGRDFNGEDGANARIQFQANPSDRLEFYWTADVFQDERDFVAQVNFDPRDLKANPLVNIDEGIVDIDSPSTSDRDLWGTSLEINYELNNGITLTSITGYRESDFLSLFDGDTQRQRLSDTRRESVVESLSQEIRFNGNTDRTSWTAGGNFFTQDVDESTQTRFFPQDILAGCNVPVIPQTFRGFPPPPPFETTSRVAGFNNGVPVWDFDLNANGVFNEPSVTIPPFGLFGAPENVGCSNPDLIAFGRHLAGGDAMDWYIPGNPALGFDVPLTAAMVPEVAQVHEFGGLSTDSVALFAHADINVSDRGTVSVGVRRTEEDKDLNMTQDGMVNIQRASFFKVDDRSDGETSGEIGYSFRFTDNFMGYAKYSRGFKSGGFQFDITQGENVSAFAGWFQPNLGAFLLANPGATKADVIAAAIAGSADPNRAPDNVEFAPETVDVYELGFKSDLLGNRVRLNLAAFFTEYDNYQQNITRLATGIIVQNVPGVEITGFDLDFTALVTDRFTITGGWGYADSEITEPFIIEDPQNPQVPLVDSSAFVGQRLAQAPDFTGNISLIYDFGNIIVRGDWSHVGSVLHELVEEGSPLEAIVTEPSYDTFNARVTYVSDSGDWDVSLWGRNIGDERYKAFRRANPIIRVFGVDAAGNGVGGFPGSVTTQAIGALPEMYGISFTRRFQ